MLLRILSESFIRRKRRKVVGILAIALGSSLATALVGISIEIGDKMGRELKAYGSNILIWPEATVLNSESAPLSKNEFLDERTLEEIKDIFWANNIMGMAPFLSTWAWCRGQRVHPHTKPGKSDDMASGSGSTGNRLESVDKVQTGFGVRVNLKGTWFTKEMKRSEGQRWVTGSKGLFRFWKVHGRWPRDAALGPEALVGKVLAQGMGIHPKDQLLLTQGDRRVEVRVTGILDSGEEFDSEIVLSLDIAQKLAGLPHGVSQVFVSALTIPENELQRVLNRNPNALSPEEYERWACSPYLSTVIFQIQDVIPNSVVEPILEVAQREGVLMAKLKGLFIFICVAALLTAGIGLTSTLMATVVERRQEVGLLRALGAGSVEVVLIFLAELAVMALIGSVLGGVLGYGLGQMISFQIFQSSIHPNPVVIFVVAGVTSLISILGGLFPIRSALRLEPAKVLHES